MRGRAFAVQPHAGDALHAGENIIHRLAALADEFRTYDFRHEVRRHFHDFLGGQAIESLAENRRHRLCERLHLRAKRDTEGAVALWRDF